MKWLFKWLFRLVVVVVLLAVLVLTFRNDVLRAIMEHRLRSVTGMDVRIGGFSSGILSPVINVEDLRLYNTPAFGGGLCARIPEIHLEYDAPALTQQHARVTLIRANVAELNVVRNEAGQTNVIEVWKEAKKHKAHARSWFGKFDFQGIDTLNLSLGTVRFVDLKDPHQNREFPLNIHDQITRNVHNEKDLYGLLILLWIRTDGAFGRAPGEIAADFLRDKMKQIEKNLPPVEAPAGKK
jgi:uncharacterized protein involved in outer membrane biogenesis